MIGSFALALISSTILLWIAEAKVGPNYNLKNHLMEVVIAPESTNEEFFFQVWINQRLWFQSNEVFLHFDQQLRSTKDQSLVFYQRSKVKRSDKLGAFQQFQFTLATKEVPNQAIFVGTIKLYDNFILFEQAFPQGLNGTSIGDADRLVTGFPCYSIEDAHEPAGFAHWVSWYYNTTSAASSAGKEQHRQLLVAPGFKTPIFDRWDSRSIVPGGIGGTGVTAIFDERGKTAVVMSPFQNPMVVNQLSPAAGTVQYGVMGNASSLPVDFSVQTILFASNEGIGEAMRDWGRTLRQFYNKPEASEARKRDITLQYLGFTTDNGAYYYYHTEKNGTYEETLLGVYNYSLQVQLPYKYVLLDSWWYLKGENGGVSNWSAPAELFPHGLSYLHEQTKWVFQGHNRYWALDNVYSKTGGGSYVFVDDPKPEKPGAVPVDPRFWSDLLASPAKDWGLVVYEQDWLFNEFFEYVSQMLSEVHLANLWLTQMAEGAKKNGLTIQYCMPFIRHLLQSLQYEVVTQARASDDYVVAPYDPSNPNWRIGGQNLLLDALGLAPSKDGYWSSSFQPGNPYGEDRFEPCPRLQAVACVLSAGPVAIADGIGYSDVDLIMKSCRSDGRLLQPSSPATLIDAAFVEAALKTGRGPEGDVWFAPSHIGPSPHQHHTTSPSYGSLFVAELVAVWSLRPSDLGYYHDPKQQQQVFYAREANMTASEPGLLWSEATPLKLSPCETSDFQLWTISPVLANGWTVLGELSKWVPVSPTRFLSIEEKDRGVRLRLAGAAGETLTVSFVSPQREVLQVTCVVPASSDRVSMDSSGHCS